MNFDFDILIVIWRYIFWSILTLITNGTKLVDNFMAFYQVLPHNPKILIWPWPQIYFHSYGHGQNQKIDHPTKKWPRGQGFVVVASPPNQILNFSENFEVLEKFPKGKFFIFDFFAKIPSGEHVLT